MYTDLRIAPASASFMRHPPESSSTEFLSSCVVKPTSVSTFTTSPSLLPIVTALMYYNVRHDSFIRVTRLIHTCDTTHPYVWHDSSIRGT